jgi:hypothetical protein
MSEDTACQGPYPMSRIEFRLESADKYLRLCPWAPYYYGCEIRVKRISSNLLPEAQCEQQPGVSSVARNEIG